MFAWPLQPLQAALLDPLRPKRDANRDDADQAESALRSQKVTPRSDAMLPKKPKRQDAETLAWEYLDGTISPSRAETFSDMLSEQAGAREQFVDCALMHGMLHAYFNEAPETAEPHRNEDAADTEASRAKPRGKKRRRSSAA